VIIWRLALALVVVPVLAACGAPAPKDALSVLAASTSGLAAGNYGYQNKQPDGTITGAVDVAGHAWWTDSTFGGPADLDAGSTRVIGNDMYNESSAPRGPWTHLDVSRLSATGRARFALDESDRSGATDLLKTVQSATLNGSVVTGKLDAVQLKSEAGPLRYLRSRLSLPSAYTAQLDKQGRLTKLTLDLPATLQPKLPAGTWTLDITGYGAATPPEKPPTFTEQPDSVYQVL
jgi:hypothetical protein